RLEREVKMSTASESSFAGSWYSFDKAEKELLRRSWRTLENNREEVSCGIYTMIFNQCPEARKLFPFMRLPTNESDKKSKEFVFQALRFIQVLESAVVNLDNLDAFNPILDNLGRRHGKLESSVGFRS
uniref:Globin family profile domain-containing protein n=1 Tax=Parascaris univalens TaxID=6257 RepID=A0A915A986_PARUN